MNSLLTLANAFEKLAQQLNAHLFAPNVVQYAIKFIQNQLALYFKSKQRPTYLEGISYNVFLAVNNDKRIILEVVVDGSTSPILTNIANRILSDQTFLKFVHSKPLVEMPSTNWL
jgi:hypothetical protein